MSRIAVLSSLLIVLVACWADHARGQNSAPSSHMVFDDGFAGDVIINEVRVPKEGESLYTYYEALGWRGRGAGYAGIQAHPKSHLFIFSIWDHKDHAAPIKAVYHGAGTETVGFGGEGTGLKSWNFKLGWSTDVWYTLLARTWPVADHTYFGYWVRAGDTGRWTHLVTMDVAAKAFFEGRTDAFIEDWSNTGSKPRTTHLRSGWKRRLDGTWFPFGKSRYSVNSWDLVPGKRSYNYRTNWDGGTSRDESGEFYYMKSGGRATTPSTGNPATFAVKRRETEPQFAPLRVASVDVAKDDRNGLTVAWTNDPSSAPQFAYRIRVFDNADAKAKALLEATDVVPHVRSARLDLSSLKTIQRPLYVQLQLTDVFDRPAKPMMRKISLEPAASRR